ncbi:MAG: FtsX-like permease family protein, partial [Melioribacteraceae bacterium]
SGGYPAFVLSAVQPAKILKGEGSSIKSGKSILRRVLVITQFAISIILIIGTILISKQMNYLSNAKLGFNKEHVVLINVDNSTFRNNMKLFKDELEREAGIESVTAMSGEPGGFHDNYAYKIADKGGEYVRMRSLLCDEDYLKTFGIKVIQGRDFSKEFSTDQNEAIILNETAVKTLGWTPQEAIGKLISINFIDTTYRKVIGVVEDYNFTSLKNKIEPLAIAVRGDFRKAAVKINGADIESSLKTIEKAYAQASPGYPFEYEFLDESFDKLYKSEKDAQILFRNFSITAIIIACLGLLGLVMYAAELKRKEIGIRKVLGASVAGIVALITKEFLVLVVIANIIAWPVSYYFMNEWLSDFAYKINIGLDSFIISALITFTIAIITIGFQAIKAAVANPVKSIKYE